MKNAVSLYLGLPAVGHLYFRGPEKANTGNVLPETDDKRSEGCPCELEL